MSEEVKASQEHQQAKDANSSTNSSADTNAITNGNASVNAKLSTLDRVQIFHDTYGLPVRQSPDISDHKTNQLRVNLLQEEVDELKEALEQGDIVEVLDALTDLQYVLDGAYLSFGVHHKKEDAFEEVQRSNMSKLGEDGKPIVREEDGKILKGPNYFKPDLHQFFSQEEIQNAAQDTTQKHKAA